MWGCKRYDERKGIFGDEEKKKVNEKDIKWGWEKEEMYNNKEVLNEV